MSVADQYADNARKVQETWTDAVQSWNDSVQKAFAQVPSFTGTPAVDPNAVIDQVFDFTQKALDAQRAFVKDLAKQSESALSTYQQNVETASSAVRDQFASVTDAAKKATGTK